MVTDNEKFSLALSQNLLEMCTREHHPQSTPKGKINPQASKRKHHEAQHGALASCRITCMVYSVHNEAHQTATKFKCTI